jgi:hypothetical protein
LILPQQFLNTSGVRRVKGGALIRQEKNMKATFKQWIFLGAFTVGVVTAGAFFGYRAVAPAPRSQTSSESRTTEPPPPANGRSVRGFVGRRVSYPLAPSVSGEVRAEQTLPERNGSSPPARDSQGTAEATPRAGSRPASTLDNPKLVTYSLEDYLAIADLDLFHPISPERKPRPVASPPAPASPSRPLPLLPAPVLITPSPPELPRPLQTAEAPPAPSAPVASEPLQRPNSPADLAVTGYVQTPKGWTILLENIRTQEVQRVSPGEEGFGYRIQYLDAAANQLVLEKDGQEVRLKLGNNKKEVRPSPKPSGGNQGSPRNTLPGSAPGPSPIPQ